MKPNRGDVERLLAEVGKSETPPPRPSFVAELEARLRHQHEGEIDGAPEVGTSGLVAVRRRPAIVGGAVAAAVIVVIAAVGLAVTGSDDGSSDQLVTRPTSGPESTAGAVSPGTTPPTPSTAAAVVVPPRSATRRLSPTTTTPRSATTHGTAPPTTTAPPSAYTMTLTAERELDGVHLTWSKYTGPNFARYLCLRATSPNTPTYPPDATTAQIWSDSRQGSTYYLDRNPPPTEVRYLMVAVDANGRELARTNVVTVGGIAPAAYSGVPGSP